MRERDGKVIVTLTLPVSDAQLICGYFNTTYTRHGELSLVLKKLIKILMVQLLKEKKDV